MKGSFKSIEVKRETKEERDKRGKLKKRKGIGRGSKRFELNKDII